MLLHCFTTFAGLRGASLKLVFAEDTLALVHLPFFTDLPCHNFTKEFLMAFCLPLATALESLPELQAFFWIELLY